ncbi:MAG: class I SAM-dependent methyltransferase [Nanoarchaeota archaeon]|nr:class I SAM-dependent methyltransferase [Nanoarchaeota archaeon]
MSKEYDIEMWKDVLNTLPDSYIKWFKEEGEYLRSNITKDATVLEIGCGDGRSLKDILSVTKNLTGIEHDKESIEIVNKEFSKYSQVKIIFAEAKGLPFEDKSFDYVICMTTFANFGDDKFKILDEMKRVMKDNGTIIISVFSENAFEERMKLYKKVNFPIKKIEGTTVHYESKYDVGISEQFTEKQLREIFNKAKLNIIELKKLDISYIVKLNK